MENQKPLRKTKTHQRRLAASACSACGAEWADHLGISGTCAENKRLRDIIRRASTKFCEDGPDGVIAAAMFTILGEASKPNAEVCQPEGEKKS